MARPELLARSQMVGPALSFVRASGGDADAIARRFGLGADVEAIAEVVLPPQVLIEVLDACAEAARNPNLGLDLAQRIPRGNYGLVEFASTTSPTLRESVLRIVRFVGLLSEIATVRFEEANGIATIEERFDGVTSGFGRQSNEFFIAFLLQRARAFTGQPCTPERVWFAHEDHAVRPELVRALGTDRIQFGTGRNGFAMASHLLDLPVISSDPPLLSVLDRTAEHFLAGLERDIPLLTAVRRRIRDTISEGPTLESVAALMEMSPRTLQRRLGEEGTTFQQQLEDIRHELAVELVRDVRRPLGEVAYYLGYSELSSFVRAFKRWTGKTPRGR